MTRLGVEVSKINAKVKGAVGEREVRDLLLKYLLPSGDPVQAKRGCQHSGGADSPDVAHNIPNLHIEVKRCEKMNPAKARDALGQAQRDAGDNLPVGVWRSNRTEYVAMLSFRHLLNLLGCEECNQQSKGKIDE